MPAAASAARVIPVLLMGGFLCLFYVSFFGDVPALPAQWNRISGRSLTEIPRKEFFSGQGGAGIRARILAADLGQGVVLTKKLHEFLNDILTGLSADRFRRFPGI